MQRRRPPRQEDQLISQPASFHLLKLFQFFDFFFFFLIGIVCISLSRPPLIQSGSYNLVTWPGLGPA